MDVKAVMDEIGAKLETIDELRVYPYFADKVMPPGAVVGIPDDITYDESFQRGSDVLTLPVFLMVSRANDRAGSEQLAAYLAGSGARSVKAAVDSKRLTNEYTSCDTVRVQRAALGSMTSAGVDLLGVEFTVQITGSGS